MVTVYVREISVPTTQTTRLSRSGCNLNPPPPPSKINQFDKHGKEPQVMYKNKRGWHKSGKRLRILLYLYDFKNVL